MTEQTGPFTDLILFAEQSVALRDAEPVFLLPQAPIDQHKHAEPRPWVDQLTGNEAESVPAQDNLSPAVMEVAKEQPASSRFLQQDSNDQQAITSRQEATHAGGAASDHRLEAGEQDETVTSAPSPDNHCKVAAHIEAAIRGDSPGQNQSEQAVLGASGSTPVSAEPASDQSGRLLLPPQSPSQEVMAGASATQQQAVGSAETPGLAEDACVAPEEISETLSRARSSGHSSPAATPAHNVPGAGTHTSRRSSPAEATWQISLSLALVQRSGESGTSRHPAAQAHPSAITTEPAGSERASFPALAEGWGVASHLEGDVPTQTAISSPENLPSTDGLLQAAAEELSRHLEVAGVCLNNAGEDSPDAADVVSPVMQQCASLCRSSEAPEESANLGPWTQSDEAPSSDFAHIGGDTTPQSTSIAHNEPLKKTAEAAQDNGQCSAVNLVDLLSGKYSTNQLQFASNCIAKAFWPVLNTRATLWLSIFRHVHVPSACGIVSLISSNVLLYPGIEAKYGGLQVTDHYRQPQGASETSSSSDAAQPSECSDSMPNVMKISENDGASTEGPPRIQGQKGMDGEPDQGNNHGALECTSARQDMRATACSSRSHGTVSATDESHDRCSSANSTGTALAPDEASTDEGRECDWAACVTACKGRLNRMLLGCGMPSLPPQV